MIISYGIQTRSYSVLNQACSSISTGLLNGICNTTDKKAKIGYVYLNEAHYYTYINNHTRTLYRHETGHIFGLGHVGCATPSIMNEGDCPKSALTTHDTSDLNSWY